MDGKPICSTEIRPNLTDPDDKQLYIVINLSLCEKSIYKQDFMFLTQNHSELHF